MIWVVVLTLLACHVALVAVTIYLHRVWPSPWQAPDTVDTFQPFTVTLLILYWRQLPIRTMAASVVIKIST